MRKCDVKEPVEQWPFIRKCKNEGTRTVPNEVAEEIDMEAPSGFTTAVVCEDHFNTANHFGIVDEYWKVIPLKRQDIE